MKSKTLTISWIVLFFVNLFTALIGLRILLEPKFFLRGEFWSATGVEWVGFAADNEKVAYFFILQAYENGFFILNLGVMAAIVTLIPYRRGERWAWWFALIANVIGWGGILAVDIPVGNLSLIVMLVVLTVIALSGIAIGARDFLKRRDQTPG